VKALFLAVAKFVEGPEDDGEEAREVFFAEECGGACDALALFGRDLQQVGGDAGGLGVGRELCDLRDDGVAQIADELARELRSAVAGVEQATDYGEYVG
jgi:hypothetical protein